VGGRRFLVFSGKTSGSIIFDKALARVYHSAITFNKIKVIDDHLNHCRIFCIKNMAAKPAISGTMAFITRDAP
jgi:hypothetical protein